GAGAVSRQTPVRHRALALHLALHDAPGGRRHDVARDSRSLAGRVDSIPDLLGLPPSDWLASPTWVIPTVALIDSWQWAPYVALIVLGGLQSLPPSVYEAAQIDGASAF